MSAVLRQHPAVISGTWHDLPWHEIPNFKFGLPHCDINTDLPPAHLSSQLKSRYHCWHILKQQRICCIYDVWNLIFVISHVFQHNILTGKTNEKGKRKVALVRNSVVGVMEFPINICIQKPRCLCPSIFYTQIEDGRKKKLPSRKAWKSQHSLVMRHQLQFN